MYIVDGVAYAGERKPVIKVSGARPLDAFMFQHGRGKNI